MNYTTATLLGSGDACLTAHVSKPTLLRDVAAGRIAAVGKVAGPNGGFIFAPDEVERYAAERRAHAA